MGSQRVRHDLVTEHAHTEHNDSPQCGDSFPKFCSPLREAVNSHTQQRQLTWPASQPSGAACGWGWSHPISLLRGPVLFTVDPLLLKHQLCHVLFKAFKTSQSATLPPSSRFRGGPRTRGAGPSSHLGRQVTRPVWALTAPGRSPPFMPDCSTSVSSLGFSLLWGLWEACCHPSSQHPGGTGHCHCPRSQRDWPR